jgi:hypothetical protein
VLNNSPSPQRGDVAPITIFTGLAADTPLLCLANTDIPTIESLPQLRAQQLLHIELLRTSLDDVHKHVVDTTQRNRANAQKSRASKREVTPINFDVGDFVLVAKRDFHLGDKLTLRWRGPRRVVGALSDQVLEVEDLLSGSTNTVHSSRLRYYQDASLYVTAELLEQVAHNEQGYAVQSIDNLRYDSAAGHYSVLVRWLGFDADDRTWEPLDIIHEDVRQKVTAFFHRQVSSPTVTAARNWLAARETPSPGGGSMAAVSTQS